MLDALAATGARVYRTDLHGTVTLRLRGGTVDVDTELGASQRPVPVDGLRETGLLGHRPPRPPWRAPGRVMTGPGLRSGREHQVRCGHEVHEATGEHPGGAQDGNATVHRGEHAPARLSRGQQVAPT